MARDMTPEQAREANAARTIKAAGPGRKRKPSQCKKCGTACESRRMADAHCMGVVAGNHASDCPHWIGEPCDCATAKDVL
jgi:hypothetical protein